MFHWITVLIIANIFILGKTPLGGLLPFGFCGPALSQTLSFCRFLETEPQNPSGLFSSWTGQKKHFGCHPWEALVVSFSDKT
ncbi:hypothetical protein PoB_003674200 [Plakobranchus ocellatus]|uniref:Secreted protein n=1 Tax=Plakobranchus ocellatus TaxID=259542 RepID=A0AAV4ASD8_9GAST|nr:hypothetical protein PoB_003674200 [Plakobranchus ocellatus]